MADLLGAGFELVEIHKLYECLDRLLEHKRALFDHLTQRWKDLFNAKFDVLLYDLTSTYFESNPPFPEDDKRKHGYSRDKRSDCVQVVIALIVTPEGFPLAYEVMAGNTADNTTLRGFLKNDRGAVRQGRAHMGDGPGHSDRRGARRNADERPAGLLPGGNAQRTTDPLREGIDGSALAQGPGWRGGEAPA